MKLTKIILTIGILLSGLLTEPNHVYSNHPGQKGERKQTIRNIRQRQEQEEKSGQTQAHFSSVSQLDSGCTAADKTRARLKELTGNGAIIMAGKIIISSENNIKVENNKGSITSITDTKIINQNISRC